MTIKEKTEVASKVTSGGTPAENEQRQAGYVMAMTALLLIPLLIFAAFATDVGAWYVRGQQNQRAADAAALAGVVWMPNAPAAAVAALDTIHLNGYPTAIVVDQATFDNTADDPDPTPQVLLTAIGQQQLRVDLKSQGEVYFGQIVMDSITLSRYGVAEYVLPVPMGSPENALGTGRDTQYGVIDNFWLRSNSRCTNRVSGDFIESIQTGQDCDGNGPVNPLFQPEGHTFIVEVPSAGSWDLQIRMTCWVLNGREVESNGPMRFTVYPPDNTPLDDYDNSTNNPPIVGTPVDFQRPDAAECDTDGDGANDWDQAGGDPGLWHTIANVDSQGRYLLEAQNIWNELHGNNSIGLALYSMRVQQRGFPGDFSCSRVGAGAWPDCPSIFGRDFLTVYSHATMFPTGTNEALLSLAEIGEEHRGKQLEIIMFDAADGIDAVQIIKPDGTPADVPWSSIDNSIYGYNSPSHTPSGDVGPFSQTCGANGPCIHETRPTLRFQDRTVRILVDIPQSYSCEHPVAQPVDCWWQVKYLDHNNQINETTTWGVQVIGDPVRLVD